VTVAIRKVKRPKSELVKILVIGGLLTVAAAGAAFWYDRDRRASCDKDALLVSMKLSASIGFLYRELAEKNCPRQQFTQRHIPYLQGPYYGLDGGLPRCEVLVRVQDNQVLVCARSGTRPGGGDSRHIYGFSLATLEPLPSAVGPCLGQDCSHDKRKPLYVTSMVDSDCSIDSGGTPLNPSLYREYESIEEEKRLRK
jgi:hypothetical protein